MEWVHISASTHLYSSHTKSFELSKEAFAWSEFCFGFLCVCVVVFLFFSWPCGLSSYRCLIFRIYKHNMAPGYISAVLWVHLQSGICFSTLKGGWGCLMSLTFLESQGCHLIPLSCLLSCFSASSSCSFCLIVCLLMVHSPDFLQENSQIFFIKG